MLSLESIQVVSESNKSVDDAVHYAIDSALKSGKDVVSLKVKHWKVTIENGKVATYRIKGKLSYKPRIESKTQHPHQKDD